MGVYQFTAFPWDDVATPDARAAALVARGLSAMEAFASLIVDRTNSDVDGVHALMTVAETARVLIRAGQPGTFFSLLRVLESAAVAERLDTAGWPLAGEIEQENRKLRQIHAEVAARRCEHGRAS